MKNYENKYIDNIHKGLLNTVYNYEGDILNTNDFFEILILRTKEIKKNNGRLFFFGNGASSAFSNHMALDWSKNGGILSFSLCDSAMITALSNDYDFESCFLEFLKSCKPTSNDLIVTTSSSGNSKNIINVLEFCKKSNIRTFGFSGLNRGNKTQKLADFSLFVPMKTYGMVECIHQVFHHLWLDKYMKISEWNKIESQNMDSNNFKI